MYPSQQRSDDRPLHKPFPITSEESELVLLAASLCNALCLFGVLLILTYEVPNLIVRKSGRAVTKYNVDVEEVKRGQRMRPDAS